MSFFQFSHVLNNKKGSTLLVALVILAALSFLGGLALTSSNFELKLSRNDKVMTQLKSLTTAVALTTAQRLENLNEYYLDDSDPDSTTRLPWLTNVIDDPLTPPPDQLNHNTWVTGLPPSADSAVFAADLNTPATAQTDFNAKYQDCEFQARDMGILPGQTLDVSKPKWHSYHIAGYCTDGQQFRIVQLGTHKKH